MPYVIAAVAAVGIVVVGLIAFALLRSGGEPVSSTSPLPEPQVTVTRTASPTPTPTPTTPSPPVTVTATTTATAVVPQAPVVTGGQTDCGRGVVAGSQTSCPFALRVADAFNATGGASNLYDVYSPVTGSTYDMYCNTSVYPVVCTGGNSAEVYIY